MQFAQQHKVQDEWFLQDTYRVWVGWMRDTNIFSRKIWLADWESWVVNCKANIEIYRKSKRYSEMWNG
jgi:hypothetical protein